MPNSDHYPRRLSIGAEVFSDGVHFRVYAPDHNNAAVLIKELPGEQFELIDEKNGYFSNFISQAKKNNLYRFQLDKKNSYPDPASRYQPSGPDGPSQIIDPIHYPWTDQSWKGIHKKNQIIYEIHVGTFTREGTWLSAVKELPELAKLGITIIQMMPVNEFVGEYGWGYDGVNFFAPFHNYGQPDDLRFFIDKAHQLGIGVILDVVYNHIGPEGNYLHCFAKKFFSKKYKTDWGDTFDFNEPEVRNFFIENAFYWLSEFHFDGLRFDATQNIYDDSKKHILAEMSDTLRKKINNKSIYLIAEDEPQNPNFVKETHLGGYGFNAIFNEDFHHTAIVRLTGRNEAYYSDYKGTPQEFISIFKYGFLYQGQWYQWQKKPRGSPCLSIDKTALVNFIQNHDQIANSPFCKRIHLVTSNALFRTITALLILGPETPFLFQGQEFASSSPFHYFADLSPEIIKKAYQGRIEFFKQFSSIITPETRASIPCPSDKETFLSSKLNFAEREKHADIYALHQDLIRLRHQDPIFNHEVESKIDGAVLSDEAFLVRYFAENEERLFLINFGIDLYFDPAPEPLIAPPADSHWEIYWASEDPKYGGNGIFKTPSQGNWHITGNSLVVLKSKKNR